MAHESRSYWPGVKARLLPGSVAGVISAIAMWWPAEASLWASGLVGVVAWAAAALLPPRLPQPHRG